MNESMILDSSSGIVNVKLINGFLFPIYIKADIESPAKASKTAFFSRDEDDNDTHV